MATEYKTAADKTAESYALAKQRIHTTKVVILAIERDLERNDPSPALRRASTAALWGLRRYLPVAENEATQLLGKLKYEVVQESWKPPVSEKPGNVNGAVVKSPVKAKVGKPVPAGRAKKKL